MAAEEEFLLSQATLLEQVSKLQPLLDSNYIRGGISMLLYRTLNTVVTLIIYLVWLYFVSLYVHYLQMYQSMPPSSNVCHRFTSKNRSPSISQPLLHTHFLHYNTSSCLSFIVNSLPSFRSLRTKLKHRPKR